MQISLLLALVLLIPTAWAASFFTEAGAPGLAAIDDASERAYIHELLLAKPAGADYVQIDDMRFKADAIQFDGFSGRKWTNGVVYYQFDTAVTSTNRQRWLAAAAEWSTVANISFVERNSEYNHIYVVNDAGNWSYVGMIGGRQEMGLYNWSYKFIIAHEIGHALGLSHEQSRSDRDSYVNILWENIQTDRENNFAKRTTTNYGSYDFDSLMHYRKNAFTKNGSNTIEPLPAYNQWLNLMGQYSHLSDGDKYGMAQQYGGSAPDLAVTSFALSKSSLQEGEGLTANATVNNQGGSNSAASTLRYYRSDDAVITPADTLLATDSVPALSGIQSVALSEGLTAPVAGNYWLGACVDTVPGEGITSNQCSTAVSITVVEPPMPDLTVTPFSLSKTSLEEGEGFSANATVYNQGNTSAAASLLRYYLSSDAVVNPSDAEIAVDAVGTLSAGQSLALSEGLTAPAAGNYWLGACVDTVSGEGDTGNQCSTGVSITVVEPARPDLAINSVSIDKAVVKHGDTYTLSVVIKNQGAADATATTLNYYLSNDSTISAADTLLGVHNINALLAGQVFPHGLTRDAPAVGGYWMGACVDSVSGEQNTANQCSLGIPMIVEPRQGSSIVPIIIYFLNES